MKDRIIRLEKELEEKRGHIGSSRVYQELLRRNRLLEEEVARLKSSLAASSTAGLSPVASSPASLAESNGLTEYRSITDDVPYSGHEAYHCLMPNSTFPGMVSDVQSRNSTVYHDNHQQPVTLDGPDTSVSTSWYKPSSNFANSTSHAGTFQHIVDNYGWLDYGGNHSMLKAGHLQNKIDTGSELWSMEQRHEAYYESSRYSLEAPAGTGVWDSGSPHKLQVRYHPAGDCFSENAPRLGKTTACQPLASSNSAELAGNYAYKAACI